MKTTHNVSLVIGLMRSRPGCPSPCPSPTRPLLLPVLSISSRRDDRTDAFYLFVFITFLRNCRSSLPSLIFINSATTTELPRQFGALLRNYRFPYHLQPHPKESWNCSAEVVAGLRRVVVAAVAPFRCGSSGTCCSRRSGRTLVPPRGRGCSTLCDNLCRGCRPGTRHIRSASACSPLPRPNSPTASSCRSSTSGTWGKRSDPTKAVPRNKCGAAGDRNLVCGTGCATYGCPRGRRGNLSEIRSRRTVE